MSCVHIYTGEGKGKTTAAVGAAVRMAGAGGRVLFFQFLKDNRSSERRMLQKLPNITLWPGPERVKFTQDLSLAERTELAAFYQKMLTAFLTAAEQFDLIVLDELCTVVFYELAQVEQVLELIARRGRCELILTGRYASEALIEAADYVTDMRKCRHPYDEGAEAIKGIEY